LAKSRADAAEASVAMTTADLSDAARMPIVAGLQS
jgi:hypothetical protein